MLFFLSHLKNLKNILIMDNFKDNRKYKTIGEVAKILNLINLKKGSLSTHTIRFGKKSLNKLNQKSLPGIGDIMMKIPLIF